MARPSVFFVHARVALDPAFLEAHSPRGSLARFPLKRAKVTGRFTVSPALLLVYGSHDRLLSNFYPTVSISAASLVVQVIETGTGSLITQKADTCETAMFFAEEISQCVGHRRDDRIFVVGGEHIELLVQLLHHGFTGVTCGAVLTGPNAGELAADIFVVPAIRSLPELAALAPRLARYLRPHGVLLLGARGSLITIRVRVIQQVLRQSGLVFERKRIEPVDMHLFRCRRTQAQQSQAA
jgi:hypothetical protein